MRLIPTTILFALALACAPALVWGQNQQLPVVFLLGQDEAAYEKLSVEHPRNLLVISGNDTGKALNNWLEFIKAIQEHAEAVKFDINGLKVFLHVFWNEDGSIRHIGYFVKPDSRNFKPEELRAFFGTFTRAYKPKFTSDKKFSHYTSANFPTLIERKQ
jgi:hypothetical protein